jgi:hypothetical protein
MALGSAWREPQHGCRGDSDSSGTRSGSCLHSAPAPLVPATQDAQNVSSRSLDHSRSRHEHRLWDRCPIVQTVLKVFAHAVADHVEEALAPARVCHGGAHRVLVALSGNEWGYVDDGDRGGFAHGTGFSSCRRLSTPAPAPHGLASRPCAHRLAGPGHRSRIRARHRSSIGVGPRTSRGR